MIEMSKKDNRESFVYWLSKKVSPAQLSELYMTYEIIDEFCMKTKILNQSLLQTTDINRVKLAQKTVAQNRVFRFQHKKEINKISTAMRYYVTYIKEKPVEHENIAPNEEPIVTIKAELPMVRNEQDKSYSDKYPLIYKKVYESLKNSESVVGKKGATIAEIYINIRRIARCETIQEILDNVSWASCNGKKYFFSESEINKKPILRTPSFSSDIEDTHIIKSDELNYYLSPKDEITEVEKTISFSEIGDLSYTRPLFASYFGDEIQDISSWKQLYVNVFKKLYEDYDNRIPINQSFNDENGRMDFCTVENYNSMVAPKEIVKGKYLETNLSATNIAHKIKRLLNICLVDEENLIIKYVKKRTINYLNIQKHKKRIINNSNSEVFYEWLINEQHMAPPTCRSYVSAINTAERYAIENGFINCKLYTDNLEEAKATVDELFSNKFFVEYNDQQHNRFRTGINKLLQYLETNGDSSSAMVSSIELEPFAEILIEKFSRGYRLNSPLELRKFKRYWEDIHGANIEMDDDKIVKCIGRCGIIYEDKVYMPQKMLDDDSQRKLFSYINNSFQSGKIAIYYEALFKEFSDDFLDHCMYNADMLKAYLSYMNKGDYCIGKKFISKDDNVNADPYDEIKNCLVQQASPMEYSEIFKILSHIPEQKIKSILSQYDEFISNGKGKYFHISAATLSDDELDDIAKIIQYAIDEKHFISGKELIDSIKKKYPYIIEQNTLLSDKGLRGAIGYKLKSRFSFKGNIISAQGQYLSMIEVFADFCKHRDSFTLDELKILKQEIDTNIYFDVVYENSLRISKNEFVSKTHAAFRPEETDAAIDRFCTGDYIAIGMIKQFGLFPDAGFNWNSFLLEHYVAMYSPNYKLIHANYNENACVGGIVKKISDIDTFDELVIDVLAKSGLPLQKEPALQHLCDEGYLARRSYSGIEQLLIKAKELRNQRGL